ncbi:hypothetical protein VTK56DRAFT_9521 [Thermocarpiscus australiensis]
MADDDYSPGERKPVPEDTNVSQQQHKPERSDIDDSDADDDDAWHTSNEEPDDPPAQDDGADDEPAEDWGYHHPLAEWTPLADDAEATQEVPEEVPVFYTCECHRCCCVNRVAAPYPLCKPCLRGCWGVMVEQEDDEREEGLKGRVEGDGEEKVLGLEIVGLASSVPGGKVLQMSRRRRYYESDARTIRRICRLELAQLLDGKGGELSGVGWLKKQDILAIEHLLDSLRLAVKKTKVAKMLTDESLNDCRL